MCGPGRWSIPMLGRGRRPSCPRRSSTPTRPADGGRGVRGHRDRQPRGEQQRGVRWRGRGGTAELPRPGRVQTQVSRPGSTVSLRKPLLERARAPARPRVAVAVLLLVQRAPGRAAGGPPGGPAGLGSPPGPPAPQRSRRKRREQPAPCPPASRAWRLRGEASGDAGLPAGPRSRERPRRKQEVA